MSGLRILRAEFGRLRGSAEAFANVQAKDLLALQEATKTVQSELNSVWYFLNRLSVTLRYQSTPSTSNQPAPHLRFSRSATNRPTSWIGRTEPKEEASSNSD